MSSILLFSALSALLAAVIITPITAGKREGKGNTSAVFAMFVICLLYTSPSHETRH